MTDNRATAYANAALAIASAEGAVDQVTDELFRFAQVLRTNDDLRHTLSDPHLPVDRRSQIAEDLLDGNATMTTVSFISLLVSAGRIGELSDIAEELTERTASAAGETVAEVRSAVALSDAQIADLERALSARTNRTVTVRNIVDESVIGGIVTRIGDSVLDGTVRTRLNQLREAF
ncbi:MAG: ATP synthase F1 subunit delta [Actinobacteria bacterium]|nr:ATP synthase F1 subunit delta [Actinomycetota bacterium]